MQNSKNWLWAALALAALLAGWFWWGSMQVTAPSGSANLDDTTAAIDKDLNSAAADNNALDLDKEMKSTDADVNSL